MTENPKYRNVAQRFLNGEIDQNEFVAAIIEEASHDMSTTFWCHVMRMKAKHDHIGDEL